MMVEPLEILIKEESTIMPYLPEEVIVDILSLLPVKSILRFRCVCKNWCNNLFKDPMFVSLHLNHAVENNKFNSLLSGYNVPKYMCREKNVSMSSVNWSHLFQLPSLFADDNMDEQSFVEIDSPTPLDEFIKFTCGSCNGLVLLYWGIHCVVLWNPSTKEIKEIPIPKPIDTPTSTSSVSTDNIDDRTQGFFSSSTDDIDDTPKSFLCSRYGLGYSPILDDYKILRTETHYMDNWVSHGSEVEIYSLRSNSWKRIPYLIPYDFYLGGQVIKPVSYNGAPHWIGSSCVSLRAGRELSIASSIVIICYDVENDTFNEVPLTLELQEPLSYDHSTVHIFHGEVSTDICLAIYSGCLSLVQGGELDMTRNPNVGISIWVMKEYGVKESWTKMFSVSTQSMERSITYATMTVMDFRNGMILFLKDDSSLVVYDPEHETARVVNTGDLSLKGLNYVEIYVESLVSLNSGIYLGQGVLEFRPSYATRRRKELDALIEKGEVACHYVSWE